MDCNEAIKAERDELLAMLETLISNRMRGLPISGPEVAAALRLIVKVGGEDATKRLLGGDEAAAAPGR